MPLDIKTIEVWDTFDGYAACFGEYDLGVRVFTGKTEEEALLELAEDYRDWD